MGNYTKDTSNQDVDQLVAWGLANSSMKLQPAAHSNLSEENLFSTSTNDEPSLNS